MSVLVAGIGNLFLGDDAFGTEVARRLLADPPPGARVVDYGTRSLHLAFALLEPVSLLVVADAIDRGAAPGTLFVVDPAREQLPPGVADAHAMDLGAVFATARSMGALLPPTRIVGCQPADLYEKMGLSRVVAAAVPTALTMIRRIVREERHHDRSTEQPAT